MPKRTHLPIRRDDAIARSPSFPSGTQCNQTRAEGPTRLCRYSARGRELARARTVARESRSWNEATAHAAKLPGSRAVVLIDAVPVGRREVIRIIRGIVGRNSLEHVGSNVHGSQPV